MNGNRSGSAYHHGDLPVTLMDLALVHIAREGTEKLSLRALAREAGVSPTAPYRHFPTKRCLLAALATRGFRQLREINESVTLSGEDLEGSFIRLGMGYIRFATDNPTTYQIMFGTVIDDFSPYPELAEAAEQSYAAVRQLIELVLASRPGLTMSPEMLGGAIWAAVHGIASLAIFGASRTDMENALSRRPNQALSALLGDPEQVLRTLMAGILPGGS